MGLFGFYPNIWRLSSIFQLNSINSIEQEIIPETDMKHVLFDLKNIINSLSLMECKINFISYVQIIN